MLDIKKIKENPDAVKAGLRAKEVDCDATVDRILELDGKIRALKTNTETQTAQKNKLAKENGKLFGMKKKAEKEGKDVSELDAAIAANNAQSVQIAEAIEQELAELKALSDEYRVAMLSLPNLPDPDLKPGGKENNEPLRYFGEPHKFDFTPKHHVDLCEGLGLIDYDRGVKLAGSGFWMYKGMGARLEWALLNYFIDCHIADGYEFILPPHMLEYQCGETAGQFPKFADEVYKIANPTDDRVHYMLPTAEAAAPMAGANSTLRPVPTRMVTAGVTMISTLVSLLTSLPHSAETMAIKYTARGPPAPPRLLAALPTAIRLNSTSGGVCRA